MTTDAPLAEAKAALELSFLNGYMFLQQEKGLTREQAIFDARNHVDAKWTGEQIERAARLAFREEEAV